MKVSILILLGLFIAVIPAHANDNNPVMGILYNTSESSWLTYDCRPPEKNKMECNFSQTSVRMKETANSLEKKIVEAKSQYSNALKEMEEGANCKEISTILAAFSETTPEDALKLLPKGFITDEKEFVESFHYIKETNDNGIPEEIKRLAKFCEDKSEESYLDLARYEFEKALKTCIISGGYTFTQNFTYVQDYQREIGAWVVEGKPAGPCGAVQLSRFVPVKKSIADKEYVNWVYVAKKAITNKDGDFFLNMKCKDLDENEYFYDWKTGPKTDRLYKKGCEIIEFSPM